MHEKPQPSAKCVMSLAHKCDCQFLPSQETHACTRPNMHATSVRVSPRVPVQGALFSHQSRACMHVYVMYVSDM